MGLSPEFQMDDAKPAIPRCLFVDANAESLFVMGFSKMQICGVLHFLAVDDAPDGPPVRSPGRRLGD